MTTAKINVLSRFPMGPKIRAWFEIEDAQYKGHENTSPTADEVAAFSEKFLQKLEDSSPKDVDQLVDILEELVGMNLPLLAIKWSDAYSQLFPVDDFRAQLHLGNAAMLIGDLSRAEFAFVEAQKLVPEEPAPYLNLTQIYCHDGLIDKANQWCEAGLDVDPNNLKLWELLAWIKQQSHVQDKGANSNVAELIANLATSKNSWAGISLACDLRDAEDIITKMKSLEKFWDEGLRDIDFLIEFTAVLGMAGHYDRIPAIVWQMGKQSSKELPWQLNVHLAQAYMGLGRDDDAKQALSTINNFNMLPSSAQQAIRTIQAELQQ